MAKNESPSVKVASYFQSGGITAHTVNFGPSKRVMNDTLRSQILNQLSKDKPIRVHAVWGDTEALEFSDRINEFLVNSGYKVTDCVISAFANPVRGLVVRDMENSVDFIVGTNS